MIILIINQQEIWFTQKQVLKLFWETIMNDEDLDNTDLGSLEARVDELIKTVGQLKSENSALRNQQESLVNERAILIEKTEQARTRIESMISRLRAMETRA